VTHPKPQPAHRTLSDKTFEQLRDLIVRGRMPSGSRVVEAEIAIRFGVSRTPVREAIARLEHEGFVVAVSQTRRTEVVVTSLTVESVRELWGMIGALEAYAVEAVASLPSPRRVLLASDLERLNVELRSAAKARPRDPDHLFVLQTAFHARFVYEEPGPYFTRVYETIRPQVQRYEWAYGTHLDAEYEPSTQEHLAIIAAIIAGDSGAAREAVLSHWAKAAVRTVATIEGADARPASRRKSST